MKDRKELVDSTMMVIIDGKQIEINIEGYVHYYVEYDYGADADGNRGTSRTFVTDISNIGAYDSDGNDYEERLDSEDKERLSDILTKTFFGG